jgi:hypothetical protein
MEYYETIDIWSEVKDGTFYCYTVFKRISDKKYAVQSRDVYYLAKVDECLKNFKKQKISLFLEENIDVRGIFIVSIETAILEFENSFND